MRSSGSCVAAVLLVGSLSVGGCAASTAQRPSGHERGGAERSSPAGPRADASDDYPLLLTFEELARSSGPGQVLNHGTARAEVSVVGVKRRAPRAGDGHGGGGSLRLPELAAGDGGPFMVLRVHEPSGDDWLTPGDRSFEFGADIMLDARSDGSAVDNGDNVVQRGLYGGSAQFKIQVDHDVPSCLVAGTRGSVEVEARTALDDRRWYTVRCLRRADTVTLRITTGASTETTRATGAIGTVTPDAAIPLTVGGKLGADGRIPTSSTDQFNGLIDNVVYRNR